MNQICEQKNSLKTGRNHCNLLNRRKGFIVFCFIILQPNKSNEPLKKKKFNLISIFVVQF